MDEDLSEYFDFLEKLRDSGVTNMFGAVPYLMDEFILDKDDALTILGKWISTYSHTMEIK